MEYLRTHCHCLNSTLLVFWLCLVLGLSHACRSSQDGSTPDSGVVAKQKTKKQIPAPGNASSARTAGLNKMENEIREAINSNDWSSAGRLTNKGLKTIRENSKGLELFEARFLLNLGRVELENGHEPEARRYYTDAMAIFHVHKNTDGRFRTFLAQGQLDARRGDYSAAARKFTEAEGLVSEIENRDLIGEFKVQRGRLAARHVEHDKALVDFKEALEIFDAVRNKRAMAETLLLIAKEEDALDRASRAQRNLDRALAIFRDIEDIQGEVRALHRLAALAERGEKYIRARRILQKVLELYQKLDQSSAAAQVERHINALPVSKK